ncbi:MAG: nitrogen regulation protein NR(I) [Gammaproteobacteria bacterium]|nr:nitrogen regulation protein NR(I) [Gammaproteobacteria bacterium]NNL99957.1 nitrogen regulation protein NR(I) [Gammaproteobacteria bacterium]
MTQETEVWIVDDDRSIRWVLERALKNAAMPARSFESADAALRALGQSTPDAIVTDIRMPGTDGLGLLDRVGMQHPDLPVIVMTAFADLDRAVAAFQGGAFEYLPKPFDVDEAVAIVERAVNAARTKSRQNEPAIDEPIIEEQGSEIIGNSAAMQEVFRAIGRLSKSHMTVLITGESGTGKELVAHALHRHSPRADQAFLALNTAAIPRDLLESELFGHEKGAFTGATARRTGRFEQADGGTLFLDEIGDMPADLQTRLLRVLADGEFYRVGGHDPINVDVRVIAATHQNLEARVREGAFRDDLYHRLNVIQLRLPPLRERLEDLPELCAFFLKASAADLDVDVKHLDAAAMRQMMQYHWPGNIRQLENACRRLTIMAPSNEIQLADLPDDLKSGDVEAGVSGGDWESALRRWADDKLVRKEMPVLDDALPRFERTMIEAALAATRGRKQEAAKLLGWGRNTLTRKLKELQLTDY